MAAGVKRIEVTAVITATFAANLPANNKVVASISLDPSYPAISQLTIPADESWVIEDIHITAAQTPDSILEFLKSLTVSMHRTAPINGLVVTNPARPIPKPFAYNGNDILSVVAQNLAAIGAVAATITVYAKIQRFTPPR